MAQRVQVMLIDDVDGTDGAETVTFALDGVTYEIDLSEDNAKALREAFSPWVGHGRRVSGRSASSTPRSPRKSSSSSSSSSSDTAAIREWARSNGHEVSERGRISGTVMEAYAAAH
jgi:hypothetical protein